MLCATSYEEIIKYKLGHPKIFHYMNQLNCSELEGIDEHKEYIATRRAMDVVGMSSEEQVSLSITLKSKFSHHSQVVKENGSTYTVVSECTCDESKEVQDKGKSLKLKIAAIISILIASTIGVCIPFLGKLIPAISPEKDIFLLIKAFAAGVILATGFIHVLPDAFENLTSPCLHNHPWEDFPFTGFVAMCTSMGTLMIDAYATAYFQKSHFQEAQVETSTDTEKDLHLHETHGHAHGFVPSKSSEFLRHRVISQVLELGIVVHSIVIGITLGASMSSETIRPLVAALTFHQFFEGIGLGSCITQAKFRRLSVITMGLFFSLTTPIGIAIGIGISNVYDDNSSTALIVEGVFNAASAGILIYMALVDFLAADFMNPRMQKSDKLQIGANISLLLGAGLMTLIAKWA